MKHWRKGLKRITAVALAVMMIGTTVDASALAVLAAAEAECTCGTDDPAFHATNCPAYIAPENPQCTCAEKCTDDTLNVWCDVCGMQGVSACQGEDTAAIYAETPDFSDAKVLTAVDGVPCIDDVAITERIIPAGDYKLESDITTNIHVFTEGSINIDLNGHTWNMSDNNLRIDNDVTLSLYDTSGEGTGKITSSYVQTVYVVGSGTTFNLYSGTVENTSNVVNARGVSSDRGSSNLYGGTIKSNAYAVFYYLSKDITINIDNTSLVCGNGHAQITATLTSDGEPCAVIDVSDYTGGALTVDAKIDKAGKIKIFTGIQPEHDAENYKINFRCDANNDFFKEKEEYEEDGGNKYVYVSVPSFTTQPTEENLYTVAFNHPNATLQWCEVTVYDSATYSEEDGDHCKSYEVNAGDTLIVSLSECSDDFWVDFDCTCNDEEILYTRLDSSRKTASVTFDFEGTVDVYFSLDGTGEYKIERVRCTELEGENGVQLSKTECETTYVCKATVGEREYYSDEVTIEQEHSYTCTATSDNVITKECANCGKSGTLTIEAEDGAYDGTTAYGATVIKTGILENEEVTVNYYQGDTLIGTDAPVNAGTYTAKITYEGVTASVTYVISTTPTAEMFTYIESVVYDGTEKSANVVAKQGITGMGEITVKYYQNGEATTPVNAGEYTVKIDVADGDIYDAATDIEVGTFTITKATPAPLTTPTAENAITYGEKLSAVTLNDSSWAWVDGTIVPNAVTYYNAYIEVDDSNYDYTDVNGYDSANHRVVRGVDVMISMATLTITANSYTIKVGEALPTYEYTVTGLVGDDTLPVDVTVSCSAADSNAVGTYPITISGEVSDNMLASYYAPIYVNGTLTIAEKDTQEITASDVALTYGETGKKISATTNGDGAITYTVATGTDVISVAADGTITALKAGTATVTITTAETDDYAEATKTISVTVNKKKIAVPAVDTNGYIYTGTAQTYGVTSTDDYTVEGGVQTNAGEYPVTITLNNENYEWDVTLGTYEFVINKVAITVTAKNYSIKVSETLPTYAYEVAGLVNGETLPIDVAISCNATNSNTAGTYTITVSGAANSANYLFTYVNGTLIVSNKEEQTITVSDVTLTYGETGKKISATTNGDGAITYTVATGTDVISVADDGSITVLKAGTATVTIRAAETADYAEAIKTISVTVSACSHRYTSKVTKQPSYTEKGERTYTCNCGHSYTEEIPKLQPSSGGNNGGGGGTSGSGTPEPTATPIPTATPKPTPAPEKLPQIQDEDGKSGWDVIGDEIEKVIEDAKDSEEKAVVTVDMNGATKVPKDIFEQIAGKDVSLEFILDNGLKWTVNGKTVNTEDLKEIDFAVTVESEESPIDSIPAEVINTVTGDRTGVEMHLAYSGEFDFEAVLTVDLEEKNAGLYANLFFYNEDAEELEFICADVIAKDGTADLTFTHASDYLIVLSETSMEPKEEGKEPEVKEPVLMKGYTVQIGAFSSEANAKKWEQKGEAINIPMFIIKDGKLFKVQTDVFETREEAAEASKKLAAAGLTNFILKTERLVTPEGEETPEVPTKPTKPETPALPENPEKKSIEDLAKEVIAGKWGNGTDRKDRLTKAGYDYREVQDKVNELLQ